MLADHYSDAFLNGDSRKGGNGMTEDQWQIVNELRMLALGHGGHWCAKAANEIERLAAEVEELKEVMRGMEVPDR